MTDSAVPRSTDIAIVGIGCRFPGGVTDPASFWKLLVEGRDALGPVPADRWETDRFYSEENQPGRMVLKEAGFLDTVRDFDPRAFGISDREARGMDPQQRLLLEVSAEALDRAGLPTDQLEGSNTGVWVGISSSDHHSFQTTGTLVENIDAHTATGGAISIASNRISFAFDLRGPSMSVDTACSSSLVATHLACRALQAGECSLALAAGVNLILAPYFSLCLSRAGMLSPRWRSRAFSADADGYARGEGVGVVVLKLLSQALADGDHVHAVIRGSAVNQDGRTPGLTMPSQTSQEAAIAAACEDARISPWEVDYVEAHGTGTPVGDPIEARALGTALGKGRAAERPLWLGSVKTNVGHLESAAGITGLIKAALVAEHGQVPPSLHFVSANPDIPMEDLGIRVPTQVQALPERRLIGVNSFGFGGTNAHIIVESPPPAAAASSQSTLETPFILPVATRRSETFHDQLSAWDSDLQERDDLGALCRAAARRRPHLPVRLAVVGSTSEALRAGLQAARSVAPPEPRDWGQGAVFAFCGQGPQWWAMGRQLLKTETVFRESIEACDALMRRHGEWSLVEELNRSEEDSRLHQTQLLQPAIFAIQVSLAELWRSWGIQPSAVVGHSMGEMAAAAVAGVLSLEDAVRVIHHRGRIQAKADPTGAMAFVALGAEEALERIQPLAEKLGIGAYNGPRSCTLTGRKSTLSKVVEALSEQGVFARMVRVNCACHSSDMDPLRDELLQVLEGIEPRAGNVPLYSTVLGRKVDGTELGADYWWQNFRQPVAFHQAVQALDTDGFSCFLELGPHPVLVAGLRDALPDTATVVPSLRRNSSDREEMLRALATLYQAGAPVDWAGVCPGPSPHCSIPVRRFSRQTLSKTRESATTVLQGRGDHPLLERRLPGATPTWETRFDRESLSWLKGHEIQGEVVVPGAAYIEMGLAAASLVLEQPARVYDVHFERVLLLGSQPRVAQLTVHVEDRSFVIASRAVGQDGPWMRHAKGRFAPADSQRSAPGWSPEGIISRMESVDVPQLFHRLVDRGYRYSGHFRGITDLWAGQREYLCRVTRPDGLSVEGYHWHPAVLDACFQVILPQSMLADTHGTFLPTGIARLEVTGPLEFPVWAHATIRDQDGETFSVDIDVRNQAGDLVTRVRGLSARAVAQERRDADPVGEHLFVHEWVERPLPGQPYSSPEIFLPRATELAEVAQDVAVQAADLLVESHDEADALGRLDALCAAFIEAALDQMEWATGPFSDAEIQAHVAADQQDYFRCQLKVLEADGRLHRSSDGWRRAPTAAPEPMELWRSLVWDHPRYVAELELVRRCGASLAQVVTGKKSPLKVLFPDGTLTTASSLYADAPVTRVFNLIARSVVSEIVDRLPEGRVLRILEVGAGTGGLTSHLVDVLPPRKAHYTFTDISPAFFPQARKALSGGVELEFRRLDIDADPTEQGFDPHSFDLIVASDALHATPVLSRTLRHVHGLLRPGGSVVLIEAQPPSRILDMTFGMTPGWWCFEDHRQHSPLLPAEGWQAALTEAGFVDSACVLRGDTSATHSQTVVIGTAASASSAAPTAQTTPRRIQVVGAPAMVSWMEDALREAGHTLVEDELEGVTDVISAWANSESLDTGCAHALKLARELVKEDLAHPPRLWFVTAGAFRGEGCPSLSGFWGLAATMSRELPRLSIRVLDLADATAALPRFLEELAHDDTERELRLLPDQRLVRRLAPLDLKSLPVGPTPTKVVARLKRKGQAQSLECFRVPRTPVGPGEVEVELRATSLNFRDLMISLGLVPSNLGGESDGPGSEAAGVITGVGEGVEHHVGDRVVILRSGGGLMGSHAVVPVEEVYALPDGLPFEDAAGLPVVYTTALYCLRELAHMEPGETVLIHSASGGLGLACVQVAQQLGLRIFGTAGRPEKRDFLRALGLEAVWDSRRLDFVDHVHEATDGRGVDAIVNSLAGPAIQAGISCLAPHGRFIEVGKRDMLDNSALRMAPFLHNLSFFGVDVSAFAHSRPRLMRRLVDEALRTVGDGSLRALPYRTHALTAGRRALVGMGRARHLGKVLVSPSGLSKIRATPQPMSTRFAEDGTYLVTGGLSGFGAATAAWLVDRGARHVVLAGRRGASTPGVDELTTRLERAGARVQIEALDVGKEDAVAALLGRLPRLRGIFHAAMVLEDASVLNLGHDAFQRVYVPKAKGAWNLHVHSHHLELDHFVLYSSASSLVCNPGQGAYVAANAFLDALAHRRRAQGLPGLAVNWGMLEEVGYVSRNQRLHDRLVNQGMLGFESGWAFQALDLALGLELPQVGVLRMEWSRWMARSGSQAAHPMYEMLRAELDIVEAEESESGADGGGAGLFEKLHRYVARTLGTTPERLDPDESLSDAGLDSLLAAEISSWIQRETGTETSVMALMKGVSVRGLAEALGTVQSVEVVSRDSSPAGWIELPGASPRQPEELVGRILVVPFVGGGQRAFAEWGARWPGVAVHCAQIPSYEDRLGEEPIADMETLVAQLVEAAAPLLDSPLVVYGHSLGAQVAFEVAMALQRRGARVQAFLPAAFPAPGQATVLGPVADWPESALDQVEDEVLLKEVHQAFLPEHLARDPTRMARAMPAVRASLRMGMRYQPDPSARLNCPIHGLVGAEDRSLTETDLASWEANTVHSPIDVQILPGGHLFCLREVAPLLLALDPIVDAYLGGAEVPVAGALPRDFRSVG